MILITQYCVSLYLGNLTSRPFSSSSRTVPVPSWGYCPTFCSPLQAEEAHGKWWDIFAEVFLTVGLTRRYRQRGGNTLNCSSIQATECLL